MYNENDNAKVDRGEELPRKRFSKRYHHYYHFLLLPLLCNILSSSRSRTSFLLQTRFRASSSTPSGDHKSFRTCALASICTFFFQVPIVSHTHTHTRTLTHTYFTRTPVQSPQLTYRRGMPLSLDSFNTYDASTTQFSTTRSQ